MKVRFLIEGTQRNEEIANTIFDMIKGVIKTLQRETGKYFSEDIRIEKINLEIYIDLYYAYDYDIDKLEEILRDKFSNSLVSGATGVFTGIKTIDKTTIIINLEVY